MSLITSAFCSFVALPALHAMVVLRYFTKGELDTV